MFFGEYQHNLDTKGRLSIPAKFRRINIPQVLRTHAHLEKECTIVGAGEHIEIWDTAKWDAFYDEYDDQFDDLSERISENEE